MVKISSFAVPASTITVTPGEGQPGDMVTLTAGNMPVYTEADYVEIGGTTYDNPGVNTDRDGNITVEDVLIPGLDPGVYSVVINVQDTIAIGEVKVLAESSAPAPLPSSPERWRAWVTAWSPSSTSTTWARCGRSTTRAPNSPNSTP